MPEDMRLELNRIEQEQARQGEQIKSAMKRIDELKALTEAVHKLSLSMEGLIGTQKSVSEKLTGLTHDVEEIKNRPAKRWDTVIAALISAAVGALLTYFGSK